MLNFIYWPISAILWFWHKIFSVPFGADSAVAWILGIVFLTFTIRLLLLKPMVNQVRSSMQMQKFAPQMQELRKRYANDPQRMQIEMRKLQKSMGVNPLAGCLPVLVQMPVFLGLFHVLRSFNRTGTSGPQGLGLSPEQNANTPNYIFNPDEVKSFLDADLFGVPLSAYISMPEDMYRGFAGVEDLTKLRIALVAAPLILIIVFATHMNARTSMNRMKARQESGKSKAPLDPQAEMQQKMMGKMMMWFLPFTIFLTGALWHIGLLFYMAANNVWTFFQQRYIFATVDREEEEEERAAREARRATTPKPGAKPKNNPNRRGKKRR